MRFEPTVFLMRWGTARSDRKRDKGLTTPADVTRVDGLCYGPDKKWNALDVYYPKGAQGRLPVIVSFHGGGYVYGTKEVYQFYGMSLAQRGFAVVNFNYHLAPEAQYPTPLRECNAVMAWICAHADEYHLDPDNLFLVGDSAGAQMASQYAALYANPAYAELMDIHPPKGLRLAAVGLNCGMYHLRETAGMGKKPLSTYFAADPDAAYGRQLDVLDFIDANYPPAYVMSAANDFLRFECEPMAELLRSRGVPVACKIYGEPEDKTACHVFHCNVRLPLGQQCNDDETAFFRQYVR